MQPVANTTQACTPPIDPSLRLWHQFLDERGEIQELVRSNFSFIIYDATWLEKAKSTNSIQTFEHWDDAAGRRLADKNYDSLIIDPFEPTNRVHVVVSPIILKKGVEFDP